VNLGYNLYMEPTLERRHVESRPGVCGGKPCIAGTRIRVQDIYVCHELKGMSPDEIVVAYPSISLADVHAALAYYFDHRDEITRQMHEENAFVDALKAQSGPGILDRLIGPMQDG
jgi:uncharacterized protein (DUF433 family)